MTAQLQYRAKRGICLSLLSFSILDYKRQGQALIGDPVSLHLAFFPLLPGEGQGEMTKWLRGYGCSSTLIPRTGYLIQVPNLQPVKTLEVAVVGENCGNTVLSA